MWHASNEHVDRYDATRIELTIFCSLEVKDAFDELRILGESRHCSDEIAISQSIALCYVMHIDWMPSIPQLEPPVYLTESLKVFQRVFDDR